MRGPPVTSGWGKTNRAPPTPTSLARWRRLKIACPQTRVETARRRWWCGRRDGVVRSPATIAGVDDVNGKLRLVLDEARAALSQQHEDLNAVRARTSGVMTFAGLAAAFVGGLSLREAGPVDGWIYGAAGAFVVVVLAVIYVNVPRTFTFSNDAATMLDEWQLPERTADETAEHLARYLSKHVTQNQSRIDPLGVAYVVAIAGFGLELTFLLLDWASRASSAS